MRLDMTSDNRTGRTDPARQPKRGGCGLPSCWQPEAVESELLEVVTGDRTITDLTPEVSRFVSGRGDGLVHVFVPHATAGVAIFELGAGSEQDVQEVLGRLFPKDGRWVHQHGSAGHGADHVLPAVISPSVSVPVLDGRPALGTWQSIALVDTNGDNPRRQVRLSFLPG
jgi:secondary thiamine-phosphate synthase enzyme